MEKIEKTEEGKTGNGGPVTEEAPSLADQTLESAITDETPESDVNTVVTEDVTSRPDDTNNNRDRNANASLVQRGRRCCLCVCCPPDTSEPTLEQLWRQKKSKQKSSNSRAYH